MRSSIVIDMAKRSRRNKNPKYEYPEDETYEYPEDETCEYPEDDPICKYLEAFGKKPENLDEAYEKLAGNEKLEIPALDLAFERLAKRHKYKNSQLDKAYKYLARQVHS